MATEQKSVYDVKLAGISLKLKSGHESEKVNKLISYVDKMVTEALPATKSGSVQNAALLAALNIAEELFEMKEKALQSIEKFEKKTQRALNELESFKTPRVGTDN